MNGLYLFFFIVYYEFVESYEKGNIIDDLVNVMIFY